MRKQKTLASKLALVLALIFLSNDSFGDKITSKTDFAFGNEIEITDNRSVIDVALPENVYQVTKSSNLEDLAVFNSKGEVVPHILATPLESKTIDRFSPPQELTLFPIFGSKSKDSNFSKIQITTAKDGTIIEIRNQNKSNAVDKSEKRAIGYLVDASKVKNKIEKFQVSLNLPQENYFTKINVEGSQDLKYWTTIESGAVIAKFEVNNEKLTKDEIQLLAPRYTYYRISAHNSSDEIKLDSVRATFAPEKEKVEESLHWKAGVGTKIPGDNDQIIYQYDLGGYYPISGLKVQFADQNSVARMTIEGANDEKGPWVSVQSSTFYTLAVVKEGAELSNLQVNFGERRFRFWRLLLKSTLAGVGSRFPDISFGWRSIFARFLARGEGPFTLAYGSSKAVNAPQSELMNTDLTKEVGKGNLKSRIALGGPEKLIVEKESKYPIRKIILWGFLLLGVVLLGTMALQVKKQVPPSI